ncbi:MAG TPA: hypothetical protein VL382_05470 [Terriglobales bacterium]|nr:hypothetical protein [Terriglobales bacterium]
MAATGASGAPVTAMQVYVDNALAYTAQGASLDTSLGIAEGWHYVVVKSWDSTGATSVAPMNINVSGAATTGGVNITSPANGAASGSPVHVTATGTAPGGALAMQVYGDGSLLYAVASPSLDTYVALPAGWHNLAVKVWGPNGWNTYSSVNVDVQNVSASAPPAQQTAASAVYNIQQQPNWDSCNVCAGGAAVPYSMTQNVANPSLSGRSTQFWLGGTTPYASALWWKELTPVTATNFKYEADYYVDNPRAVQGLEFDVNQVIGGYRFIFGTECDVRYTGMFRVWDTFNGGWVSTGIPCPTPAANVWHHIVWEFQRTSAGQARFVAVTLDGVRHDVDMSYWGKPNGGSELSVAFQLDGNYMQENYSAWVDNLTLTYW